VCGAELGDVVDLVSEVAIGAQTYVAEREHIGLVSREQMIAYVAAVDALRTLVSSSTSSSSLLLSVSFALLSLPCSVAPSPYSHRIGISFS